MAVAGAEIQNGVWASVWVRLIAWLLDRVVVVSPVLVLVAISERLSPTPNDGRVHDDRGITALSLIVMTELLYQLVCNIAGTSVGKRIFRLRVIRLSDGGRPGLAHGVVRFLCAEGMVITLPFSLPAYLVCNFNEMRRAAQDFVSGTAVVRVTRQTVRRADLTPA